MNVTLICDASYCNKHKVAGYGFWIACQRGKVGGAGQILQDVENNNTAEMMAICNAIWKGISEGVIEKGDALLIQSDCLSAMDKMMGIQPANTQQENAVLGYYEKTLIRNDLTVQYRHVRGHTSKTDSRSAAQRVCDNKAKVAMRAARRAKIAKDAADEVKRLLGE